MLRKLEDRDNGLFINYKKGFNPIGSFKKKTIEITFDFAYDMSFGEGGRHRDHRSGGSHSRKKGEIFANTFQGKLSEFAVYNVLYKQFSMRKPDLDTYDLGEWDSCDFEINDKKVSVKSTKSYGNLLLLETKDWNNEGQYIPNIEKGHSDYDIFILVRINPYCEDILRGKRVLYSNACNKDELFNEICGQNWTYDIAGFATKEQLKYAISNKHIIRRKELLNGRIPMDADNYYIQSGDMIDIGDIKSYL